MRILSGVILTLLVLGIGGVSYVYSGLYNVAASDEHTALGKWVLHTTMDNSVSASAEGIDVPDLTGNDMVQQGGRAYDSLCAACHLKPGMESTVLRAGLNPMPPALTEPIHWEPAEQFWIVKHGVKMTGMPAWGETHGDEELWEMVAFVQRLPELSEQEYNALVSPSASSSEQTDDEHAQDDGHDHEHGNMNAMMGSSSNGSEASHDDGHDHEHGDMSGMMDSSESGANQESDSESTESSQEDAEADDHYADGHSH